MNATKGLRERIKLAPTVAEAYAMLQAARDSGKYSSHYLARCERAAARKGAQS